MGVSLTKTIQLWGYGKSHMYIIPDNHHLWWPWWSLWNICSLTTAHLVRWSLAPEWRCRLRPGWKRILGPRWGESHPKCWGGSCCSTNVDEIFPFLDDTYTIIHVYYISYIYIFIYMHTISYNIQSHFAVYNIHTHNKNLQYINV